MPLTTHALVLPFTTQDLGRHPQQIDSSLLFYKAFPIILVGCAVLLPAALEHTAYAWELGAHVHLLCSKFLIEMSGKLVALAWELLVHTKNDSALLAVVYSWGWCTLVGLGLVVLWALLCEFSRQVLKLFLFSDLRTGRVIAFHGTSLHNARSIEASGFRASTVGMLGGGVYLSRDVRKVTAYSGKHGKDGRILMVSVDVGSICLIDHNGHPKQSSWQKEYDVAWVPPHCGMVRSGLEEFCIRDASHVKLIGKYSHSAMGLATANMTFCMYSSKARLVELIWQMMKYSHAKAHERRKWLEQRQRYRDHCRLWKIDKGLLRKEVPDAIISGLCSNRLVPPALSLKCSVPAEPGGKRSPKATSRSLSSNFRGACT